MHKETPPETICFPANLLSDLNVWLKLWLFPDSITCRLILHQIWISFLWFLFLFLAPTVSLSFKPGVWLRTIITVTVGRGEGFSSDFGGIEPATAHPQTFLFLTIGLLHSPFHNILWLKSAQWTFTGVCTWILCWVNMKLPQRSFKCDIWSS